MSNTNKNNQHLDIILECRLIAFYVISAFDDNSIMVP